MSQIKIAHLILCHTDPEIVKRTATRLAEFSDVYIHIDKKADKEPFILQDDPRVFYLEKRYDVGWGTWTSVQAEVELIREALSKGKEYDRLVLLQGLDYPIKSDHEIEAFFYANKDTEFIKGCMPLASPLDKIRYKVTVPHFSVCRNIFTKALNVLFRKLNLEIRKGIISENGKNYDLYWGSAQWALTGKCAGYIVDFYDSHDSFNRWFYMASTVDELYFTTIVHNSRFRDNVPKAQVRSGDIGDFMNLDYFKYLPGHIKVFDEKDYDELTRLDGFLYARKMKSGESAKLLDLLDMK